MMNDLSLWAFIIAMVALVIGTIGAIFAFLAYSTVVGVQNSTHQVAFQHLDPSEMGPTGDDLLRNMGQAMGVVEPDRPEVQDAPKGFSL